MYKFRVYEHLCSGRVYEDRHSENSYIPALDILYYLYLHRLNLSSFSSPIHHITTYVLWSYYSDCSRPAVIYLYMGHLLWTLVNLRRGFSVGYFHVKSVPELVDAGSTWDSFMSSQHVNIRDYKELFPVIGAALASGHIF